MCSYRKIGNGEKCHESMVICWLYVTCDCGIEHLFMDRAMCDETLQNAENQASKLKMLHI